MICKMFEVRDAGTFIPVMAVKLEPGCEADRYLLARAGYGRLPQQQAEYIYLATIGGGAERAAIDPYDWSGPSRTMAHAHQHIQANFDRLDSGAVIDVQFILGETPQPKLSESRTAFV